MDILLCNDDGILAPGIRVLYEAVRELGHVHIVAPSEEQSAVGHAITVFDPIKMRPVSEGENLFGYAVSGTPADCVKLAVCELLDQKPDFLFSGVNLGANTGVSVIYSGTVSAATEATLFDIPSIAFSLTTFQDPLWETASRVVYAVTRECVRHGLPEGILLNVNIPNVPYEELNGYAVTTMARSRYAEKFHKRSDPRGNLYFWLDGEMETLGDTRGTDVEAVSRGQVSITPIGMDMTRHEAIEALRAWSFA